MTMSALRLAVGAVLAWSVGLAVVAPEIPAWVPVVTTSVFVSTLWQPWMGLVMIAALTPVGTLFARDPAHGAELLAWAFLAAWLLGVWRPLAHSTWPTVSRPATLYAACAATSWLGLTIAGAVGVSMAWLPAFLWRTIPADYLLFSTPSSEAVVLLQTLAGIGVFLAGLAIIRDNPHHVATLARAIALSMSVIAAATAAQMWSQWAANGYGSWIVTRFVDELPFSRFSPHLQDLNAAGSLYVLAALSAAGFAMYDRRWRWLWGGLLVMMAPALWATGSRTALLAATASAAVTAIGWRLRHWRPEHAMVVGVAALAAVAVIMGTVATVRWGGAEIGGSSQALRLRWQFAQTSARMFAEAPVLGVGIGQYHGRSSEFMPAELRAVYPNENAHNYFAQQFAELGVVGGSIFLWLVVIVFVGAWRHLRSRDPGNGAALGLFGGCVAYVLTCLPGHPLLVPEAALPFWAALGALGGLASGAARPAGMGTRLVTPLVCLALAAGLLQATLAYAGSEVRPDATGLYEEETAPDGTRFRWTTRHATIYGGRTPGFVRLAMRAPAGSHPRPFVVETWVEGRVVDRSELSADDWLVKDVPVLGTAASPFRRIDLHVNQSWVRKAPEANAPDEPVFGVMAAEFRWVGLGSR